MAASKTRAKASDDEIEAPKSLTDRAYRAIEERIVTLRLAPGAVLSEASLAQELDIGRTPIREALQRLVRARLIEVVPRRGLRITAVRVEDQLALLAFRREVERFLATRSAERATPADRRRFRELAADMDACARTRDEAGHYRFDLEYKLLLVRTAGNDHAGEAIVPLWASSRRFAWVTRAVRDIALSSTLSAAVMRAIADGDGPRAAQCTDAYMDALEQLARSSLDVLP